MTTEDEEWLRRFRPVAPRPEVRERALARPSRTGWFVLGAVLVAAGLAVAADLDARRRIEAVVPPATKDTSTAPRRAGPRPLDATRGDSP